MKATEAKLLQILGAVSQFIIPIYQRTYSWTQKECQQLWIEILRAGSSDAGGVHFIGSVVRGFLFCSYASSSLIISL
jgi:uncharacterized protein with ParB-like and HNH nuclease domain